MPFVLDNSVASGWFLADQASPYTDAIALRMADDTAHVPALWELEVTNVLRSACLRRRMTATHAQTVLSDFELLPIVVDRTPVRRGELLGLALRFGLTSYDASYLELALRLQVPVATRDGPLHDAALAAGVGVVAA